MKAQEAKHDAEQEPLARRVAVLEEELLGVTVSRGYLVKLITKASASLAGAYNDLLATC